MFDDIIEFFRSFFRKGPSETPPLYDCITINGKTYGDTKHSVQELKEKYAGGFIPNQAGIGMPTRTISKDGLIYENSAPFGTPTQYIDNNGYIYDNSAPFGTPSHFIDNDGLIYDNSAPFGVPSHCVDSDGYVYENSAPFGVPVGRINH